MGPTSNIPLDSDALRANIAGTAQEVVIPNKYLPLLAAVDGYYGVREPLRETLGEYFHRFRNIDAVISGLQATLLRNWSYFERWNNRGELFSLLSDLVLKLVRSPLSDDQTSTLLRQLFLWCSATLDGPHAAEYQDAAGEIGRSLAELAVLRPLPFLDRDTLLRDVVRRFASQDGGSSAPVSQTPFLELYRVVLQTGYRRIGERLDVPAWASSREVRLNHPEAAARPFSYLAKAKVDELLTAAESASLQDLAGSGFPTFSDLVNEAIDKIFRVEDVEDRFAVCLFFLKDDTLGYRQHKVMVDLLAVVKAMMQPTRRLNFNRILRRLTRFFHAREGLFPEMRFQCYEAIGLAIGEAANQRAADHLVEDLLSWHFQYPEIRGATDEWATIVNPYHLPNVRCWMAIIESNPALYERLAAALNVQLRTGGVFIADTDLFQRDITRFLNSDIRSIYFVAKQMLRVFPVYFNEVGAEGELRSVSTEIDEIYKRQDTLSHFLRKQVHAESSNRLVDFSRAVLKYWGTLDVKHLEPFLSPNTMLAVMEERQAAEGPNRVLHGFAAGKDDRRRVELLRRLDHLLREKYSPSTDDLEQLVSRHLNLRPETRAAFVQALGAWGACEEAAAENGGRSPACERDELLNASLEVLEELKRTILAPAASQGVENIYHKRHIAAGIPSMYGDYTEPKFDALGLSLRVEQLVGRLLEDAATEAADRYITRPSLRRIASTLKYFERALLVDGVHSQDFRKNRELLEAAAGRTNFTFRQCQNILQFIAQSVSDLTRSAVLSHDQVLHTILRHDPRQCEYRRLGPDAVAEAVLREVLVSALGLQTLDRYVSYTLGQMNGLAASLEEDKLTRIMNYDPDRLVSWLHEPDPRTDDQITMGYKALGLKHMIEYGYRVPEGFGLSTELFAVQPALTYKPVYDDTIARIRAAVARLEQITGLVLGDPERPLTLSIRSGAAISMPGLMTTLISVGMNDEVTEGLARTPGMAWTAWDSYRRFLQSWAMSSGIDRDVFDSIMYAFKARYDVAQKLDFTADQMREMALTYKGRAVELGVELQEDCLQQVVSCIDRVLASWYAPQARFYRSYIGVAEEWGTAVIVQRMVLGNLGRHSGAGVVFTRNPLQPHTRQVRLFGDFAICSQGEDLVGGLVFPLPISESQRRGSPTYRGVEESLETAFPEVYAGLLKVAQDLVTEREYDPQELEFTFESPAAKDLYILQKRSMVEGIGDDLPVFDRGRNNRARTPAAVGMGVAGGAYAGRVAFNMEQIDRLLANKPGESIILLRPDTVPEDIPMVIRVQGILTARGGATSHAAVTAKRLGKTAVVDCRALEVLEQQGIARLAGRELHPGEWLSIDGRTGHIFFGRLNVLSRPPIGVQGGSSMVRTFPNKEDSR
jgi:pyruvate, orthophosphate dikinase